MEYIALNKLPSLKRHEDNYEWWVRGLKNTTAVTHFMILPQQSLKEQKFKHITPTYKRTSSKYNQCTMNTLFHILQDNSET